MSSTPLAFFGPVFWVIGRFGIVYFIFWLWMFIHCIRNEQDRYFWLWIFIILWFVAPIVYFFARWLPSSNVRMPPFLRSLGRGGEIKRLATAAQQIGNAHQFVELANALRETNQYDRAGEVYEQALAKEEDNQQALWGASLVDIRNREFESAKSRLERLLELEPEYKFGDVSLAYGKTLFELGDQQSAREQLEKHVRRWRHPESLFLLAAIYQEEGRTQKAREQLQALLLDINGSPKAIARKHSAWKGRARKLLKTLPRE